MPIKSLLKQAIKNLPEGSTMKAESVVPTLLKKGVKQEEIEFSGIELPGRGRVSREELLGLEEKRTDMFYTTVADDHYKSVSLPGGVANPTYREKVLRFEKVDEVGDRYTSTHFPDMPNYLAHTRIYDEDFGGTPTRVLQEIQSDLHQAGRQYGYGADTNLDGSLEARLHEALMDNDYDEANDIAGMLGIPDNVDLDDWAIENNLDSKVIPKSPYEKSWLTKSIEREVSDAIDEGRQQLAIPIKGAVDNLQRAEGVQKWYESQVLNTANKVAKKAGMEFTEQEVDGTTYAIIKAKGTVKANDTTSLSAAVNALSTAKDKLDKAMRSYREANGTFRGMNKDENLVILNSQVDKLSEDLKNNYGLTQLEYQDVVTGKGVPSKSTFTPDSKPNFMLYSTPTAGAFAAYTAYKSGYSEDQVTQQLMERGYDEEEIAEINTQAEKIAQAEAAGYSREEIEQYLQGQELTTRVESNEPTGRSALTSQGPGDPRTDVSGLGVPRRLYADVKQEAYDAILNDDSLTAQTLVANLQVLQPTLVSDTMTSIPAFFGNKEALQRYDIARQAARDKIINIAKRDYDVDLVWQPGDVGVEEWYVNTEQGPVKVTPTFWQELNSEKGELVGGIAGGIAGYKYAPPHPVTRAIGAGVGAFLGAAAGAGVDYLATAMEMQTDMEAEVAAHKALNAGELAIVGEVVGYPIAKGIGAGWNGIVRAKDMIFDGNSKGAYRALKETMFMNDDEIDEIVTRFERLAGPLEGNKEQRAIQAVTLGERGMQDLVRVAGALDPQASRAVIKSVDDRAQDLLSTTADLTDPEVARAYIKDLNNYVGDVKGYYDAVKAKAVQSPRGLNFDWDFDTLAIVPVLDKLYGKITDPFTSEKFLRQAARIRSFSESRNFGDLIELRQIVNDFLYNKNVAKADDKKMLRNIIGNIDNAIKEGAPKVVENPEEWLKSWGTARIKYTEMKKVEQTALYKMVFDKKGKVRPVQPETVVKGLTKYITALDGSFEEVMSKLPTSGRSIYEAAVVDSLANKFTAGTQGGMRAVNFPMLADELKAINFTTPDARAAKQAILEMSEVFKNDVYLAQASGKIEIPKFQSYLTADPVVRAKFEVASGIFNYVKTWAPGNTQRNFALVRQTSKLLEKPLDAKTSKELIKEFEYDVNMTQQIKQLQQEAARAQAAGRDLGGAKILVDANGKFVNSVDAAANKIPAHRVASEEIIKNIADREGITVDNPNIDAILKQYGYVATMQGSDRLRMLGDK